MGLFSFFTQELAIDLGTANTIIIYNDKIVVDEPSIVATDRKTGKTKNTKLVKNDKGETLAAKTYETDKDMKIF